MPKKKKIPVRNVNSADTLALEGGIQHQMKNIVIPMHVSKVNESNYFEVSNIQLRNVNSADTLALGRWNTTPDEEYCDSHACIKGKWV